MPPSGKSGDDPVELAPDKVTRRKLIRLGAAGTVGLALAGCNSQGNSAQGGDGQDGSGGQTGGDGGSGSLRDDELTLPAQRFSPQYQWNNFNSKNLTPRYIYNLAFPRLAFYTQDREWVPVFAEDWSFPSPIEEGTEVEITLRDDLTWHNGEDVTAEDYVRHFQLEDAVLGTVAAVDSFETVDETTFKAVAAEPINPEILQGKLLYASGHGWMGSPDYEKYKNAIGEDPVGELSDDLTSELVSSFTIESPTAHGPWEHVETTNQHMLFEAYDDYALGDVTSDDPLDVPSVRFLNVTDTLQQSVSSDNLDQAGQQRFFYNEDNLPGDHAEVRSFTEPDGFNLSFDHRKEYLGKRRVRQAIAFALDQYAINLDMAPEAVSQQERQEFASLTSVTSVSPLTGAQADEFLGDDVQQLEQYGAGAEPMDDSRRQENLDRAAELLQEEGFTREDGQWITPDGEQWSLSIVNYGEWDWMSVSRSVMGQLNNFGIDVEQNIVESSQFWSNSSSKENEYDLKLGTWSAGEAAKNPAHPWHNFEQSQRLDNYVFSRLFYKQHPDAMDSSDLGSDTEYYMEAPMPVGDPDGEVERVNLTPKIKELRQVSDPERIRELTLELAWFHNQYVMTVPLIKFLRNSMVTTDDWNWEPEDGPLNTTLAHIDRTGFPIGLVKGKRE